MNQKAILKLSITKVAPLFELIKKKGIDINHFLSEVELDADILNYPDNKISLKKCYQLFMKGAVLTNDNFFGLHVGELFVIMSNILGYIMMNCSTAGKALEKYIKYQELTEDIKIINILQHKNNLIIEISIKDEDFDKDTNLVDYNLTGFLSYFRALTGKNFYPIEARFRHPDTGDISEYQRVFGSRLIFCAQRNALVVPKEIMQVPVSQPNKELLIFFEKHINEIYKNFKQKETYTEKVKKILIKNIKGDIPSLTKVARYFSMSVRSLQNKLNSEGNTYSAILNSVRKDIALEYLKDKSVPIAEISFLLGFSEPSAFHRSFKKWTNTTPNMLRLKYLHNN